MTYPDSHKKLANKIFASLSVFTLLLLLVVSLALLSIFYFTHEHNEETRLTNICTELTIYTDSILDIANNSKTFVSSLEKHFSSKNSYASLRFTLIQANGTVLFDSATKASNMENHLNRPEVQAALDSGTATSTRISNTLGSDTLYVASMLENKSILRLSENRESFIAFLGHMSLPIFFALVLAVILALAVSRQITKHIVRPVENLDLTRPLENDIYSELLPLLKRVDDQQKHLQEQNRQLSEADNIRREFSANVSHELKTPLQVISGYAELMKEGIAPAEDTKKFSEIIYNEADDMRRLVDEVLTLSKLDEPTRNKELFRLDLLGIAQNAYQRLESFACEHKVTVSIEGDHAIIQGNETLLEGMMHNLIENGIRYNHEDGYVKVNITEKLEPVHCAIITVSDNGIGIPESSQAKVFERFFRVDKSRNKKTGGTGLGLAIVKHAAEYHGGNISLESTPEKGSTFTIVLPLEE